MTQGEVIAAIALEGENGGTWSAETIAGYDELITGNYGVTESSLRDASGYVISRPMWERFAKAHREWRRNHPKDGKKKLPRVRPITAKELGDKDIPPLEYLIDEMLPVGLTVLASPPKYFKSYMAIDICLSIATGREFLGFKAHKHKVLYLDLESTERRTQERIRQVLGNGKPFPPDMLVINGDQLEALGQIGDGFEDQISAILDEYPDLKLVILDVLQLVRKPEKGRQNAYDRDYTDLRALKHLADDRGIGLFLIHHTSKRKDGDPYNNISGSTAMLGAMDTAWLIEKEERFKEEAVLSITGRDIKAQRFRIKWDGGQFYWKLIGTEEEVTERQKFREYDESNITFVIRELVKQHGGSWEGSATEIQQASRYIGGGKRHINEDAAKIGKFINAHITALSEYDGLTVGYKKTAGPRLYSFSATNAITYTNATSANTAIGAI